MGLNTRQSYELIISATIMQVLFFFALEYRDIIGKSKAFALIAIPFTFIALYVNHRYEKVYSKKMEKIKNG